LPATGTVVTMTDQSLIETPSSSVKFFRMRVRRVILFVLFGLIFPIRLFSQNDIRAYRNANHLIMATRQLKPDESFQGLTLTVEAKRYAILKWGAGCFVSRDGLMLTANHVVSGGDFYFVGGWNGDIAAIAAEVKARDENLDLALMKIKPPSGISWIARAFADSSSINEGTNVFIWAYLLVPAAFMQFLRSGIVSNNQQVSGVDHTLYVEATAIDGTNGSPVFLRGNGQPVGIVNSLITVGGASLPAGIIGVVPGEQINRFLKNAGVPRF